MLKYANKAVDGTWSWAGLSITRHSKHNWRVVLGSQEYCEIGVFHIASASQLHFDPPYSPQLTRTQFKTLETHLRKVQVTFHGEDATFDVPPSLQVNTTVPVSKSGN